MNVRCLASICFCSILTTLSADAAPFLEGQVTDEQGRPIEGATVTIRDCLGTCLGGKSVLTDREGHYVFETKPFRNFPSLEISMPGRYEAARTESGPKLHEADTDEPRVVNSVLGTPAAVTVRLEGEVPEGWTQTVLLRAGKDAKLHRYDLDGHFTRGWETWNFEMVPRSESYHLVVAREPIVEPSDDRKEMRERQRLSRQKRLELISPPIRFVDPQRYNLKAEIIQGEQSESTTLTVVSLEDVIGNDRIAELVVDDPQFGPPVDAEKKERALALLKKVEAAARPWNARPEKSVMSYEYDAVDAKANVTHIKIDQESPSGPAWSDISRLRGFAYMPPLRWLFSQPENIDFHQVEIGEDKAVLVYRLKSPRGFAAGLGVGPSWNGFFSKRFSAGTIVIDSQTATVLEHRFSHGLLGEESVETLSNYVELGDGLVPTTLRIESGQFDFRLAFKIHEDRLWLLEKAIRGEAADAAFEIKNVVVSVADKDRS